MSEIVIHGHPGSPLLRSVQICCEEKGISYCLGSRGGEASASERRALVAPFAGSPILEHGRLRIYETQVILRYLDVKFPLPRLQPADAEGLGRMRQMMRTIADVMSDPKPCVREINRLLGYKAFLAGDQLSLADLVLAPQLDLISLTPEGERSLRRTALGRWLERMQARPSMRSTQPPHSTQTLALLPPGLWRHSPGTRRLA